MSEPLNPLRTISELQALRAETGDDAGAQRVAWTDTWARARGWLREKLAALPVDVRQDEAGNLWATLAGDADRALVIGGHLDSVPDGGWLDGALNTLAGLEVLRRIAGEGRPPVTVRLVDWADEEGARFGHSMLGSSAASGALSVSHARTLRDRDGVLLPDAMRAHGVDLARAPLARRELDTAAAYLELHIEQGPVLEGLGLPLGVVLGTFGVERHLIRFTGQAAHAGATPMDRRRDAFAPAARLGLAIRDVARAHGGLCTVGRVTLRPGIHTAVAGVCEATLDQRHADAKALAAMVRDARELSERFAGEERCEVAWTSIYRTDPIAFHPALVDLCDAAVQEIGGASHRLFSGPLHDAAEMARAGVPTVMMFVQSLRGISHNVIEDTKEEHLVLAVEALDRLATKTIAWIQSEAIWSPAGRS